MTLESLCLILYAAAKNNGHVTQEENATEWCESKGYLTELCTNCPELEAGQPLTRSQVVSVLAAFLQSAEGTANRADSLLETMKSAIAAGGDGTLYILNLDITNNTATSKAGDSALILFPDGQTMLIDTLNSWGNEKVMATLEAVGLVSLDYLVLSHAHADHIGNMQSIINMIYNHGGTIGHYYSAGYLYTGSTEETIINDLTARGVDMHTNVREGDSFTVGDVTVEIFNPSDDLLEKITASGDYGDENINNVSVAMKFTYGESSYFTAGDLYMGRENVLVEKYGSELQADVMQTNHHGVYTSNGRKWIDAVNPEIMLTHSDDIGDASLAATSAAEGREYYTAGLDGIVLVTMDDAANYTVQTQYDSDLRKDFEASSYPGTLPAITQTPIVISPVADVTIGDADFQLEVSGGAEELSYQYTSDNQEIVTVDATGRIHIVGVGTATITVTKSGNGYVTASSTVTITVKDLPCNINGHEAGAEATCTEPQKCTVCGEVLAAAKGHKLGSWVSDKDTHWHSCEICNTKVDEGEHTWDEGKVTVKPTPTKEGVKTFTCTVCEETRTEALPKTNGSANTGDEFNMSLWLSVIVLSAFGIGSVGFLRKKKK